MIFFSVEGGGVLVLNIGFDEELRYGLYIYIQYHISLGLEFKTIISQVLGEILGFSSCIS